MPSNVSYDEVSTIPMALTTAYSGLYSRSPNGLSITPPISGGEGQSSGIPLVVLGGAGSVGQMGIHNLA